MVTKERINSIELHTHTQVVLYGKIKMLCIVGKKV